MSWSYNKSGPALEVAKEIKLASHDVDKDLSTGNPAERALHARAVALIDVACHEGKEHDVVVEAYGHYDGKHNHISIKFDGVDAPPVQEMPVPIAQPGDPQQDTGETVTPDAAAKPRRKRKTDV